MAPRGGTAAGLRGWVDQEPCSPTSRGSSYRLVCSQGANSSPKSSTHPVLNLENNRHYVLVGGWYPRGRK